MIPRVTGEGFVDELVGARVKLQYAIHGRCGGHLLRSVRTRMDDEMGDHLV